VVTRVTVDVVPHPGEVLASIAFFPTLLSALEFVVAARRRGDLRPRALELIDRGSLELVRDNQERFTWPGETGAAIIWKEEVRGSRHREKVLEAWSSLLESILAGTGTPGLFDAALVLESPSEQQRLRSFRHRIPSVLNEVVAGQREQGGGKLGTDWWVPYGDLPVFLESWRRRIEEAGLPAVMFGHVGNGHPHVNLIPRSAEEYERGYAMMLSMCREAVALGGGVAGEHGLGKVKRNLLAIQYSPARIGEMRQLKRSWDPRGILGRGNLFEPDGP
jgi:FAD/FMN-containing dehydrogenase